ncbi:MAG: 5-nucleotidase [Firmicutes bacterium]|nr:5-nucleotidase [Bacillota bacterium]
MQCKKIFLSLVMVCMIIATGIAPAWAADVKEVIVLSVNDFHGNLLENSHAPGLAKLAGLLRDEQKQAQGKTILLSAGDMFQGEMESNITLGAPVIAGMNALEFTAMCLGNHEFDWGLETMQSRLKEACFPFLAANIVDAKGAYLPKVKPYTIVKRNGIKVGIIGLTTPQTKVAVNPKYVEGLTFLDGVQTVNKLVPELKAKGAEVIVVLAHMGSEAAADGVEKGEIIELAKQVTGVDLIVSGHTHRIVNTKVNGIPIVQAGKYGNAYGKVKIEYDEKAKKVVAVTPEIVKIEKEKVAADMEFAEYVRYIDTKVSYLKNEKVGETAVLLWHNRYGESLLGQWVTDVIRQTEKADIAVMNGGGLRNDIAKGVVTKGNLYATVPFDNTLVKTQLTGREIKELLEYGLGNNGHGLLQFSGITVTFDDNQTEGNKITQILLPDGSPIDFDAEYTVATIDFIAAGGDGIDAFKNKKIIEEGKLLRDALQESFVIDKPLNITLDKRLIILQANLLAG